MTTVNAPEKGTGEKAARARPLKFRLNGYLRWLHIYTSMLSLLIVLFFALTGITLNHPDWVLGSAETRRTVTGTLPAGWKSGDTVNWLSVVEAVRAQTSVHGSAGDYRSDSSGATFSFRAPGYGADVQIEPSGKYSVNIDAQGALAVLNDLHRGRDTGGAWAWVIDLSGGFLALVALTGLALLLYLKKIRARALLTLLGGAALVVFLAARVM